MKKKKLAKALKTIKKECHKHETCHDCPLRTNRKNPDNLCFINNSYGYPPYAWKINEIIK